jgi:hypothetical protein
MPRGGKRIGSGRKAGAVTKRTRQIADQAITQGISPLEVMLHNMRFAHSGVDVVLQKILAGELDGMVAEEGGEDVRLGALRSALKLAEFSQKCAIDAAPFIHPRMSPTDGKAKDEGAPLAERLKEYARRDAIEGSAGKVVELKGKKA